MIAEREKAFCDLGDPVVGPWVNSLLNLNGQIFGRVGNECINYGLFNFHGGATNMMEVSPVVLHETRLQGKVSVPASACGGPNADHSAMN